MPATYTHHIFTKDVYKSLNIDIQKRINPELFNLFGKSFDAFFFYKPKIGSYAHNHCANLYFANPIKNSSILQLLQISLLLLFSSIWVSMLFARSITKPIEELAKASKKISRR